jgi:transposase-like protein
VVSWIDNKKGWLKGYKPERETVVGVLDEPKPVEIKNQKRPGEKVVEHIALKCPYCHSKKVKCYGADKPILYYKCTLCKKKFKVLER